MIKLLNSKNDVTDFSRLYKKKYILLEYTFLLRIFFVFSFLPCYMKVHNFHHKPIRVSQGSIDHVSVHTLYVSIRLLIYYFSFAFLLIYEKYESI